MKSFISRLVALPDPVKAGITAVVVYVLSLGFANLLALLPFLAAFAQFVQPAAVIIAMALIGWIEKAVPDAFGKVAVLAVQLILALLAVYGIGAQLTAMQVLPALLSLP